MHSSRMRTARCNCHFSCHTCPLLSAMHAPLPHMPPPPSHTHPATHAPLPCTCPLPHMPPCHACPPPPRHAHPLPHTPPSPLLDRILDTCLWKYLAWKRKSMWRSYQVCTTPFLFGHKEVYQWFKNYIIVKNCKWWIRMVDTCTLKNYFE